MGILNTLPTLDESIDSIQASDPEGQPSQASHPRGTQSESLMPVIDVETTSMVATPEATGAPEGRPLSDVQPQRLSGRRRHDADMRFRHLFQKAGAVAGHLYDCDVGMVRMAGMLMVICIGLYHLWGVIIYALQDQDIIY